MTKNSDFGKKIKKFKIILDIFQTLWYYTYLIGYNTEEALCNIRRCKNA